MSNAWWGIYHDTNGWLVLDDGYVVHYPLYDIADAHARLLVKEQNRAGWYAKQFGA